ncbi:uncharacterized protein UDID_19100 [Ustilago sp. UG-2017a]|nr:uncharacterized protein UDID_19100 [Ustilago sp. UG-2017a]
MSKRTYRGNHVIGGFFESIPTCVQRRPTLLLSFSLYRKVLWASTIERVSDLTAAGPLVLTLLLLCSLDRSEHQFQTQPLPRHPRPRSLILFGRTDEAFCLAAALFYD